MSVASKSSAARRTGSSPVPGTDALTRTYDIGRENLPGDVTQRCRQVAAELADAEPEGATARRLHRREVEHEEGLGAVDVDPRRGRGVAWRDELHLA